MKIDWIKILTGEGTTVNVKVEFSVTGDNTSSEEFFKFLQKYITDGMVLSLEVKDDMYTFTITPSSESEVTNFLSKVENILDELLIEKASKRYYTKEHIKDVFQRIVERKVFFWFLNLKVGDIDIN